MPLLYKYLAPDTSPDGKRLLPAPLRTMTLKASDPSLFNDPFEVRPYFDQARLNHFAQTHETFHASVGVQHSLVEGQSILGFPTEDVVGLADDLNERFRNELARRFRVLCLTRTKSNILMWGHYTNSYQGLVIGIDTDHTDFPKGQKPAGFDIAYSPDRSRTRLPLAFYRNPTVELWDAMGRIVNPPDQPVETDGGLVIPFREYRRQLEGALITALSTKAQDWSYEEETRFVYDTLAHRDQLIWRDDLALISIPPESLREIIIGFRTHPDHVRALIQLYRQGKLGNPQLFSSSCHPFLYQVQTHETDAEYLLETLGS